MRIAVIDLGTNTFNLIVAETHGNSMKILENKRSAVKLGKGGIGNNIIMPDAFERGIKTIESYKSIIEEYKIDKILAFGTSALRTAQNSDEFVNKVLKISNIKIEIISGDREAELIYNGIIHSIDIHNDKVLILDIGGGSNEFIIADQTTIYWKESFKLGMARLIEKFTLTDPISNENIIELETYFEQELQPLFKACEIYKPKTLIGAEGSFESFFSILKGEDYDPFGIDFTSVEISLSQFKSLFNNLKQSTINERLKIKGLEPYRVEMIVPAIIFVNFVMNKIKLNKIIVSFYSLKEGAAWENLIETK